MILKIDAKNSDNDTKMDTSMKSVVMASCFEYLQSCKDGHGKEGDYLKKSESEKLKVIV